MDTNNPMVSFCVLFYNQENFVRETLDAMLNQDYKEYEIIIRDDYSTDNTRDQIQKYIKENKTKYVDIKVEYGKENLGIIKSLNRVIGMAEGEFIALQGGDDVSLNDRISKSIELILKYKVDLVGVDAKVVNENKETIFNSFYTRNEKGSDEQYKDELKDGRKIKLDDSVYLINSNNKLVGQDCLGGFGLLFNKKLLNYYGGILPQNVAYEDRLLTFLAHMNKGCIQYNKQLVLYRRTSNNVSMPRSIDNNDILNNMIKLKQLESNVCKAQIEYLKNNGFVNKQYNKNEVINCLNLEYYKTLFIIKSLNRNLIKEKKFYILKKIITNPNIKSKSSLKSIIGFFTPFLYRRKVVKEYNKRLVFFGN